MGEHEQDDEGVKHNKGLGGRVGGGAAGAACEAVGVTGRVAEAPARPARAGCAAWLPQAKMAARCGG